MDERTLSRGEKDMLRPIFGNTLPYEDQLLTQNFGDTGGVDNSITTDYTPAMSRNIWTWDFSKSSVGNQWIFVHEMTHAWQWYHGYNLVYRGLKIILWGPKDYDDACFYDVNDSDKLSDFNFEQQATMIADAWFLWSVSSGLTPDLSRGARGDALKYSQGMRGGQLKDYLPYLTQLRGAGPPSQPYIDHSKDWKYRRMDG